MEAIINNYNSDDSSDNETRSLNGEEIKKQNVDIGITETGTSVLRNNNLDTTIKSLTEIPDYDGVIVNVTFSGSGTDDIPDCKVTSTGTTPDSIVFCNEHVKSGLDNEKAEDSDITNINVTEDSSNKVEIVSCKNEIVNHNGTSPEGIFFSNERANSILCNEMANNQDSSNTAATKIPSNDVDIFSGNDKIIHHSPETIVLSNEEANITLDNGKENNENIVNTAVTERPSSDASIVGEGIFNGRSQSDYRNDPWTSDESPSSSDESNFTSESSSSSSSATENDENSKEDKRPNKSFAPKPKTKMNTGILKTKGELTLEDLPPIEDLNITLPEEEPLEKIGVVHKIVDQIVLIQALKGTRPLDIDSVLFLEERKPLGQVFDVLGPVIQPFYAVRFNSARDIENRDIAVGLSVFSAPGRSEVTTYVFTEELRKQKGSDASWKDNNEPPIQCLDFSDDEEERQIKQKRRAKSRAPTNGDADFVHESKTPSRTQKSSDKGHWTPPSNLVRPTRFQMTPRPPAPVCNRFERFRAPPPIFGALPPLFTHPPPSFPPRCSSYRNPWPFGSPNFVPSAQAPPNFGPQHPPFAPPPNQNHIPLPNFFVPPPNPSVFGFPQNGFGQSPNRSFPQGFFFPPPPPPPPL